MQITIGKKMKLWNYFSNIDCEAIRARIALKLGRLLNFLGRNAFLFKKKSASMW